MDSSMDTINSNRTIVFRNNIAMVYEDDETNFRNDPELFNPSIDSSEDLKKRVETFKDLHGFETTRSHRTSPHLGETSPTKSPLEVSPTVSIKSFDNNIESVDLSSLFDSTHELSKNDYVENNNIRELFRRILVKMDIYEDKLETLIDLVDKENSSIKNELESTRSELDYIKITNNKINKEVYNINEEMYYMDCKIIENNQYARRESLVISGIPDNVTQNDLEEKVLFILRSIGLTSITSYNISACHRLMKKKNDSYPAQTIVRFTNRKVVHFCLNNRDRLVECKNYLKMNLRFYESLCDSNKKIYDKCFDLKKYGHIEDYYIRNGFVKVIKKTGNKPIKLQHPDDLRYHFQDFYDCNDLYVV